MKVLSLNICKIRGTQKRLSICRHIDLVCPNIILVQETMVYRKNAWGVFSKLFPSWEICSVDAEGFSRGFLSSWNLYIVNCIPYFSIARILLEGFVKKWNRLIKVLKCYGPYKERFSFYEEVARDGILLEDVKRDDSPFPMSSLSYYNVLVKP